MCETPAVTDEARCAVLPKCAQVNRTILPTIMNGGWGDVTQCVPTHAGSATAVVE